MFLNYLKNIWIIQLFAVLHATVSLLCRAFGMGDEMMLTLLTMMMVVIICLHRRTDVIYMTMAVIVANIVGFLFGRLLAIVLAGTSLPDMALNPLSTFICTEIIGFGTDAVARTPVSGNHGTRGLSWGLLVFVIIIITRLVLSVVFSENIKTENILHELLLDYVFSCIAVLLLAEYALRLRREAERQAESANLANFKYMNLKQRVNPHFLFNSLNVLDCMIQDNDPAGASEYTHKLAGVYRYMIHSEDETTVPLKDEMEFVMKYIDLQKVRFSDGIKLEIELPDWALVRKVVPCSLQLLIENAMKHNVVSVEKPLEIKIYATKNSVIISNTLNPRLSPVASAHLGHKYLRERYKDIAQKSIIIKETADRYTVILPLL